MSTETWLLYVTTTLVFMSTPGPSHLLMLSTSMSNGFRRSLATAAGDLTANVLQILLAGFGLAAVITATRHGLTVIKWGGVIYLIWIGARQILSSLRVGDGRYELPRASLKTLWLRGHYWLARRRPCCHTLVITPSPPLPNANVSILAGC